MFLISFVAPLWKSFLTNPEEAKNPEKSRCVLFLVDASIVAGSISETGVHLIDSLNSFQQAKKQSRVLIVYSKIDLIEPSESRQRTLVDIKQILRIDQLRKWYKKYVVLTEVEYSAITGQGINKIRYWLNHCYLY